MNFKKIFLFLLTLAPTFTLFSQGGANSIYSQYGMGMLYPHQFGRSFGMGNTGYAISDNLTLNSFNPASVADLQYTTFDVNVVSNTFQSKDGVNTPSQYTDASLGTIAIGTPLLKNWGAMLGLTPFSSMGYSVKALNTDAVAGNYVDYFKGFGGINSLFFGTGYRYKGLSLGAKANYLFGTFNQQKLRVFDDAAYFSAYKDQQYGVFDFTFDFGAQYRIKFNDNAQLTIGAVYGLQQNLNGEYSVSSYITSQNTITDPMNGNSIKAIVENTTENPSSLALTLPSYFGGGLAFKYRDKLTLAFDYKQQDWSGFQLNAGSYNVGKNYNFGAEYVPNKNSIGNENYHKRIAYRFGLSYQKLPLEINVENVNDLSATIGVSFPLRKFKFERELFGSVINFGVQAGRRGTVNNGLVQDNYIKLNLGFTLNDKWYIKRKFD
jgi:hypothetical protein